MRNSPTLRRAPVHRFADGVVKHVPTRTAEQALQHEIPPRDGDPDPLDPLAESALVEQPDPIALGLPAQTQAVTLRPVTTEDVDQLWDWSRSDAEGVTAFLGRQLQNSRELFTAIGRLASLQQSGAAWMQSIARDSALIGFVLVCPIQRSNDLPHPVGTVHIYVSQSERGDLQAIVQSMLDAYDGTYEPMTLSVIVSRPEWAAVLQPLGFESSFVLTRPALAPDGSTWA